jgi:N-acetylglucosamine kinase-like BadF-type ATPase
MELIIEAGGTKCRWGIGKSSGNTEITTQGFNPNFSDIKLLHNIIKDNLLEKLKDTTFNSIYYFGAGCANPTNQRLIEHVLSEYFKSDYIKVASDLEGAAKAIFKENKGRIGILGTGASAGYYNGNIIKNTAPSLGYLLGDEGSGAYLGKELIKRYLRDELDEELTNGIKGYVEIDKPDLIKTIYSNTQTNSYLASFVNFIILHQDHPAIIQLLTGSFMLYYEKHIKPLGQISDKLPLGLAGGVAWQFKNLIADVYKTNYHVDPIIIKEAFDKLMYY